MSVFGIGVEFGFGLCFAIYICDIAEKVGKYLINKYWKGGQK